ncbi:MAG: sugar phosphate isomerase/epimerase, partial [Clostridia bacterium]|nr:sugar phosphate isomerase/epimerase [Clostridia bacterium]
MSNIPNKISFSTLGCPEWTLGKIMSEAKSMGYGAIELRGILGEFRAEKIPEFTTQNRAETRQKLAENGLVLCAVDTSCKFYDAAILEAALDEFRAALDLAVDMGASVIRVFGDPLVHENSMQDIVTGVGQACEMAQEKGVAVCLETHGVLAEAKNIRPLAEKLSRYPAFGVLWDITHTWRADRDWMSFLNEFMPVIKHLHIRDITEPDAEGKFDFRHVGEGDAPLCDILQAIAAKGYSGYYSLEWEKKWHPEIDPPEMAFPKF